MALFLYIMYINLVENISFIHSRKSVGVSSYLIVIFETNHNHLRCIAVIHTLKCELKLRLYFIYNFVVFVTHRRKGCFGTKSSGKVLLSLMSLIRKLNFLNYAKQRSDTETKTSTFDSY